MQYGKNKDSRANLPTSSKQAGIRFSSNLFNRNPQAKPYLKISARAGMAIVSKPCLFESTIFRHADGRKQKERIEYALFYMGNKEGDVHNLVAVYFQTTCFKIFLRHFFVLV